MIDVQFLNLIPSFQTPWPPIPMPQRGWVVWQGLQIRTTIASDARGNRGHLVSNCCCSSNSSESPKFRFTATLECCGWFSYHSYPDSSRPQIDQHGVTILLEPSGRWLGHLANMTTTILFPQGVERAKNNHMDENINHQFYNENKLNWYLQTLPLNCTAMLSS